MRAGDSRSKSIYGSIRVVELNIYCFLGGRSHQAVGAQRQYGNQAPEHTRTAFLPEHSRRHPEFRTAIQR